MFKTVYAVIDSEGFNFGLFVSRIKAEARLAEMFALNLYDNYEIETLQLDLEELC